MNLVLWQVFHTQVRPPDHTGPIAGLSYNGANRWQSPADGERPSAADIDRDLALLSRHTRRIRTYSAADHPELPALAQKHGLQVMLGAWIDDRLADNQRELAAAVALARSHPNIPRVIVGNETQLKARLPPNRLAAYLDQARSALRSTPVQVSTAEPWHVWLEQPQLAQHVDFIAIHVLPYWEGESIDTAVKTALQQIARVKARFPDRPVVVAEIGWPSNGPRLGNAQASAASQALFIRGILQEARSSGLDYYLIEAFDQPWKIATEGRVGAHWGLWDTWRNPKFAMTGPVDKDPHWRGKAWVSSLLGAAVMLPFLLAFRRMRLAGRVTFCAVAQAVASLSVVLLSIPLAHYLTLANLPGLALVAAALAFIGATLLAQAFEFSELFWPGSLARHSSSPEPSVAPPPFVSIHLACANEPPDMVVQAVESLLALDWPAFEVIVVDNNTVDERARETLADWMRRRNDPRLRFIQHARLPGFKAGALNKALAITHPSAQWIAVVDADYVVDPQWLNAVQAWLRDPSVGLVQAPQAHREWSSRPFGRMMNWETDGFFRIGMHHRHERNAIIQHGTMTLVRALDLRDLGWNEDCICEDTELGLRLLRSGYQAVYVDRVLGAGLLPRDFSAYGRQRKRWAQGAMQIFRLHAGALLGPSPLTMAQRYHFLAGWLPWLGDALHFVFSLIMILFSLGMVFYPRTIDPPFWLFVVPLIAFFAARLLAGPLLYARRVPCGLRDRLGAAVAGMALSHRIARGVLQGLWGRRAVFEVTQKAASDSSDGSAADAADASVVGPRFAQGIQEEFALLAGLVFCILLLALSRDPADTPRLGWLAVLCVQSLPYWAALACRLVETQAAPTNRQAVPTQPSASPGTRSAVS
jgi:exo-beta-1,3-glucanase (GH17 family)/cellulose synthase/poly-beta-1,6-N-acetylglucosamine synthase-like glycosyltransferase